MRPQDVNRKRDRPKAFILPVRRYLVKLRDLPEPVEVIAEHRGAARHYAKCCAPRDYHKKGAIYREVEWCRLKANVERIPF
jgi:hypothetical protein